MGLTIYENIAIFYRKINEKCVSPFLFHYLLSLKKLTKLLVTKTLLNVKLKKYVKLVIMKNNIDMCVKFDLTFAQMSN